jgi:soluble lytic murein transglycosylase-like protein
VTAAPAPAATPAGQAGSIEALLTAQAQAAGVSVPLVKAVAWQESGWRMVTAVDGGMGVMQLMPATVDWLSTSLLGYRLNPYDAADNIRGGVALLAYYLRVFGGNQQLAVAAYHQGLASVQGQGINANTAAYVASVLALEQRFMA